MEDLNQRRRRIITLRNIEMIMAEAHRGVLAGNRERPRWMREFQNMHDQLSNINKCNSVYKYVIWSYQNFQAGTYGRIRKRKRRHLTLCLRERELGITRGTRSYRDVGNAVDLFRDQMVYRQTAGVARDVDEGVRERIIQETPFYLRQRQYRLGKCDKIFAAQWLDEANVLLGTKCSSLLKLNLQTGDYTHLPLLQPSKTALPAPPCPCGLHALEVNPSRTLMATCAASTNHVAVYELEGNQVHPYSVQEGPHKDYLFDITWLDDERVASVSRDSRLAIHRVPSMRDAAWVAAGQPGHAIRQHVGAAFSGNEERRFRAVEAAMEVNTIGVVVLDGWLNFYDPEVLSRPSSVRSLVPYTRETVCLQKDPEHPYLMAVGSQSHITFFDVRSQKMVLRIASESSDRGVRSLNFNGSVFTYGTGDGAVYHYELRHDKHIRIGNRPHHLTMDGAWLKRDENFQHNFFPAMEYPNAAYVHVYDVSRSRMLVAGGPLAAGLWGHAVNLWC